MYLIRKKSDVLLFLADRNKTKKYWWTYSVYLAMKFHSFTVAKDKVNSLKYGEFEIISEVEAYRLRDTVDKKHTEKMRQWNDNYIMAGDYDEGDSEYWNDKDI